MLPHLRQFVRVRHALAGAGALRASLGALLDNRHAGVIQLDRHGRIAAANDLARDLLRLGDRLSDRDGGLCIPSSAENTTLQQLLGRALPHYGDRGVSSSMVMTRPNGTPPTVLHVIPVDAERSFRSPRVAALVLIVDIDPKEAGADRTGPGAAAAARSASHAKWTWCGCCCRLPIFHGLGAEGNKAGRDTGTKGL